MNILTLNAGSSSLKYRLFHMTSELEEVLAEGTAEGVEGVAIQDAAQAAIARCRGLGIDAVGHRVVHGGARFTQPTRITGEVLADLRRLSELDPLHNPIEVALIEAAQCLLPGTPAVAVFDTAFHQTLPAVAYLYALPREFAERLSLRRYGFHGISHRFVSETLLKLLCRRAEGTRLITCHLGSGASICAIRDGKSVDTSMGLTPLEGLVMGTRCGDIDPGLLLYLLRTQNMTPSQLDDLLNHNSGLLGLTGIGSDVREIETAAANGDANAELALETFAYRACKYIAAYTAVLDGVDAVAFTGGIGENSAEIRRRICRRLSFLGLCLDSDLNDVANGKKMAISANDASVQAWVIPTDEERQIARETHLLASKINHSK